MKLFYLILLTMLISTGCMPGQPNSAVLDEPLQQKAFLRFIDAETDTERKQALETLQRDFPQSPLTAHSIELNDQKAQSAEQQLKIKKLAGELNRCRETITQREAENDALHKDLEQLKQLLIEMEMRAR